jgi:predicted DNA-binding transcriptional regulator AlpA
MSSTLDNLPAELARHRILSTKETCTFVGLSVAEWRILRNRGQAPAPILIGMKKHGWRCGDLIDWISSRAQQPGQAA